MRQHLKLLLGYDGSPCGDAALHDLQRAGLPQEVEAVVLSAADVFLLPPPPDAEGAGGPAAIGRAAAKPG